MSAGISQTAARFGHRALLADRQHGEGRGGAGGIGNGHLVAGQQLSEAEAVRALARIALVGDQTAQAEAGFIIEAADEREEVRRAPTSSGGIPASRFWKGMFENTGDPKYRPASLLTKLVKAGWLDRSLGRGFYG